MLSPQEVLPLSCRKTGYLAIEDVCAFSTIVMYLNQISIYFSTFFIEMKLFGLFNSNIINGIHRRTVMGPGALRQCPHPAA